MNRCVECIGLIDEHHVRGARHLQQDGVCQCRVRFPRRCVRYHVVFAIDDENGESEPPQPLSEVEPRESAVNVKVAFCAPNLSQNIPAHGWTCAVPRGRPHEIAIRRLSLIRQPSVLRQLCAIRTDDAALLEGSNALAQFFWGRFFDLCKVGIDARGRRACARDDQATETGGILDGDGLSKNAAEGMAEQVDSAEPQRDTDRLDVLRHAIEGIEARVAEPL